MGKCIAGADGCRTGWVIVREDDPGAVLSWQVVPSLQALFEGPAAPSTLAIDVPIGLPDLGARYCDTAARSLLGRGKASSVFPAPIRPVLAASSHAEASAIRHAAEGKRMSIQAWAIIPKIRDVDAFLRSDADARSRVHEVHPEVCFYFMAGRQPMSTSKKTAAGRAERLTLLTEAFRSEVEAALRDLRRLGYGADDLLDAFAELWTARRIRDGLAETISSLPSRDRLDLLMKIVA